MAINLHSEYTEVFKFVQSGWFELFEEVLDFRKSELRAGREYLVTYVGPNSFGHLTVRMVPKTD